MMGIATTGANEHEVRTLRELYLQQVSYVARNGDVGAEMGYLESKLASDVTLQRQIRVFDMYAPYVRGRVLDWGCNYGMDSCLIRMRWGDTVQIYSCDVRPAAAYKPFDEFSRTTYTMLDHPYRLNYPDEYFDLVISDGVLEHVPDDVSSVKEIHRILKPGGTFVVTCLPNRFSYTEAVQRTLKHMAHERLYSMKQARRILKDNGFRVMASRYFLMMPTMLNGFPPRVRRAYQRAQRLVWLTNDALERLWPLNRLASNLLLVVEKS